MRPFHLPLILLLLAVLLSACAPAQRPVAVPHPPATASDQPVSIPDRGNVSVDLAPSPNALPAETTVTLTEGETQTLRILGKLYTLRLSRIKGATAAVTVNAQDFTLRQGEEFSFGDFLLRLDAFKPDAVTVPKSSTADVTLSVPGVGAVRDVIGEGEKRTYAFPDGSSRTLRLEAVGTTGKGDAAGLFSVDGEEAYLTERENGLLGNSSLFVHYLSPVKQGAALAQADITIIQNT